MDWGARIGVLGPNEEINQMAVAWIEELRQVIQDPERVVAGPSDLDLHAQDFSYHPPHRPDAIVYPLNTEEVSAVVRFAQARKIPVIGYGQGTSVEGHIIPIHGGITVDFSRMNRVVALRPKDFVVQVQPGVTRTALNTALGPHGLFFPVDPGADASLGGMAATNAAGTEAFRYGAMRQQVLGLEVVLSDGAVARLGGATMKSSAGYQLVNLFIGSEGTLGLFTELTLKVYPIPQHIAAARACFDTVEAAGNAAMAIISATATATRIELMDQETISAVNQVEGTNFPSKATLFFEFASHHRSAVLDDLAQSANLIVEAAGYDFVVEWDPKTRRELWHARHRAALAILAASHGTRPFTTDTAVPLSELSGALRHARATLTQYGIQGAVLGHVGDGNYHVVIGLDPANAAQLKKARMVNDAIIRYAWQHGGTCTGEHGIGIGKTRYLQEEKGLSGLLLWQIKHALDPGNIFNPGKTLPLASEESF
jgi:D-lactate dehydrogenase (cytochrome)